ncbi:MAG: hypothetical protein AAF702_25865 [Chloroflexota bacterium]
MLGSQNLTPYKSTGMLAILNPMATMAWLIGDQRPRRSKAVRSAWPGSQKSATSAKTIFNSSQYEGTSSEGIGFDSLLVQGLLVQSLLVQGLVVQSLLILGLVGPESVGPESGGPEARSSWTNRPTD